MQVMAVRVLFVLNIWFYKAGKRLGRQHGFKVDRFGRRSTTPK